MNIKDKFTNKLYMSSTVVIRPEYSDAFGFIESLTSRFGPHKKKVATGVTWCLDNGVFAGRFDDDVFIKHLDYFKSYIDNCLFINCPDVLFDSDKTLDNFYLYYELIKIKYGFPIAFVLQDGFVFEKIPVDLVDAFFVGGSTEFKLSSYILDFVHHCNSINKWCHIGRVNSKKRLLHFKYADSWDGTHLSFQPSDDEKFYNIVMEIRKEFE